jgi:hypothetical protein
MAPKMYAGDDVISTHSRSLETDTLASFTNSQLHRPTNDTALGSTLRFTFAHKEAALGSKPVAALVADKAALVPLSADSRDDQVIQDVLLAPQTAGRGATAVALETPGKTIFFDEGSRRVKGL